MHVLIATDGSENSLAAARAATRLLRDCERVTLLCVVTEMPGDDAGSSAPRRPSVRHAPCPVLVVRTKPAE